MKMWLKGCSLKTCPDFLIKSPVAFYFLVDIQSSARSKLCADINHPEISTGCDVSLLFLVNCSIVHPSLL